MLKMKFIEEVKKGRFAPKFLIDKGAKNCVNDPSGVYFSLLGLDICIYKEVYAYYVDIDITGTIDFNLSDLSKLDTDIIIKQILNYIDN